MKTQKINKIFGKHSNKVKKTHKKPSHMKYKKALGYFR